MNIYLAGKITGDPDYREKFQAAKARLERDGVVILNPAALPEGLTKADYMRMSFAMIDAADTVDFLPDAVDSPGAQLERRYCEYIGKPFAVLDPPQEAAPLLKLSVQPPVSVPESPSPQQAPVEKKPVPSEPRPWSGFVHIRCDHCHKESTFCLRSPIQRYECRECGRTMDLPEPTTAYINCECGNKGRYITNITDWGFDIPCGRCGAPNAVKYLPGKDVYVPVDQMPRRRKGKKK